MRQRQTSKSRFLKAVNQISWNNPLSVIGVFIISNPTELHLFYKEVNASNLFRRLYSGIIISISFARDSRQRNTYLSYSVPNGTTPAAACLKLSINKNDYPGSPVIALRNLACVIAKHECFCEDANRVRRILTYDWYTANALLQLFRCQYGENSPAEKLLLDSYKANGVKWQRPRKREISPEGHLRLIERGKRLYEFKKMLNTYQEF